MFEDYRDKSRGKKFRRNFCSINQNKMKCIAPFTTEFVERDFRWFCSKCLQGIITFIFKFSVLSRRFYPSIDIFPTTSQTHHSMAAFIRSKEKTTAMCVEKINNKILIHIIYVWGIDCELYMCSIFQSITVCYGFSCDDDIWTTMHNLSSLHSLCRSFLCVCTRVNSIEKGKITMRWDYRLNNPSWFISSAVCRREEGKSLGLDVDVYRSEIYQQIRSKS